MLEIKGYEVFRVDTYPVEISPEQNFGELLPILSWKETDLKDLALRGFFLEFYLSALGFGEVNSDFTLAFGQLLNFK